ncbi:MAG: Translation initiation factor 6 [Candidatus Woesearchaeota archaeon]|nr:Translation initiation factor 6 [Candidatus Woesearchaeota archaeon]
MGIDILSFRGNPNIGLFTYCNDKFCLVGNSVREDNVEKLKKNLEVDVHQIRLAGTDLVGVFAAGNNNCLLVPDIVFEQELKVLDKLDINYKIINTKLTALGNNILCNEHGAIINSDFEDSAAQQIEEALQVRVKKADIASLNIVGALCVCREKKGLVSINASKNEIQFIYEFLGFNCTPTTISRGTPYLKSGIINNSKGMLISELSTGVEISQADTGLGYNEL